MMINLIAHHFTLDKSDSRQRAIVQCDVMINLIADGELLFSVT